MAKKHSKKTQRGKLFRRKAKRISSPHKSFRRSYREDYQRELNVPGVGQHVIESFRMIFKNWKLFLPLLIIMVVLNFLFVGLMNGVSYERIREASETMSSANGENAGIGVKAGVILMSVVVSGVGGDSTDAVAVYEVVFFLIVWLTTIFLLRHIMAGHKVTLRDGLYNAMAPLVSTFVVFVVAVIQSIPIMLLVVAYSAAVKTGFLTTPFYALVFVVFAMAMIMISAYLLSSSLLALVAVSAPGLYPMKALNAAADLMMGRRIRFILRLVALILVVMIMWVVVMLPLIMFDLGMKNFDWAKGVPFVPICFSVMTYFTMIYVTTYLYLYYRYMIDGDAETHE